MCSSTPFALHNLLTDVCYRTSWSYLVLSVGCSKNFLYIFVGHVPDYIANLLTPASDISPWSSLHWSSNCDFVVPKNESEDWWLCCRTPCMESAAVQLETLAFDYIIQEQTGELFCFMLLTLGRLTKMTVKCASGLIIEGRTTSGCCYCYCLLNWTN